MKLRLLVGVPVLVLPLALVLTWQYNRTPQMLVPLLVTYVASLVVALLFDRAEKAGGSR